VLVSPGAKLEFTRQSGKIAFPMRDLPNRLNARALMRKNLISTLFALYALTLLIPIWWPFDFQLPTEAKPYFQQFEPMEVRYRWHLEKDLLKLAMFIPVGIFLVMTADPRLSDRRIVIRAILIGSGLSILMQSGRYFLPVDTPGLTDIFFNVAGTSLGASVVWLSSLSRRMLAGLTIACVLCFVVAATWPAQFSLRAASRASLSIRVEWSPFHGGFSLGVVRERALNGLMMMPLGLLGATYALRSSGLRRALVVTTRLGFCSSVAVELMQCFLPNRTPSLPDITLNTLGTFAGAVVAFYIVRWETARTTLTAES
jgi:glycopeptide antibiotics resistance protein